MSRIAFVFLLVASTLAGPLLMGAALAQQTGFATEMNGYTLKQFGDFTHSWHFVTVRFRRDTAEQRFVYANDIAWQALNEHSKDYPDGAVFAKIGVMTEEDPAFIDSSVPTGAKRVQFMLRNRERHKGTDGWGYAVFNMQGQVAIAEPQKSASFACNGCHQVVRDRGLVFSQAMPDLLQPVSSSAVPPPPPGDSLVTFASVDATTLPDYVRAQLPPNVKQVLQMQGSIPQHVFHGTIFEAVPLVAAVATRANMPAVLIGQNGTPEFSLLWPASLSGGKNGDCKLPGGTVGRSVIGGYTITYPGNPIETRYQFKAIEPYCSPAAPPPAIKGKE